MLQVSFTEVNNIKFILAHEMKLILTYNFCCAAVDSALMRGVEKDVLIVYLIILTTTLSLLFINIKGNIVTVMHKI